jgi:hypothetical protein
VRPALAVVTAILTLTLTFRVNRHLNTGQALSA